MEGGEDKEGIYILIKSPSSEKYSKLTLRWERERQLRGRCQFLFIQRNHPLTFPKKAEMRQKLAHSDAFLGIEEPLPNLSSSFQVSNPKQNRAKAAVLFFSLPFLFLFLSCNIFPLYFTLTHTRKRKLKRNQWLSRA